MDSTMTQWHVQSKANTSSKHRPRAVKRLQTLLKLELADALRSRWLAFTTIAYVIVFGAFIWFGLRESAVLGFTGLSRVVLNIAHAIVLVVPLMALIGTCQAIVRARQTGLFELLLVQPCRRGEWFAALLGARLSVLAGPLVLGLVGVAIAGLVRGGEPGLLFMIGRSLSVSLALLWCFVGIGLWISAAARTPERATVLSLAAWLVSAALHDFAIIGVLLRAHVPTWLVFGLATSNPVQAARVAVLTGVDPELSVLGPVGFWIANTLGQTGALLVGVGWPLVLGTLALWLARRAVAKADLVG